MADACEVDARPEQESHPCSVCGRTFPDSEMHIRSVVALAMRPDGAGCDTSHDISRLCKDCERQTPEERTERAYAVLLQKREREREQAEEKRTERAYADLRQKREWERKETEERQALYQSILQRIRRQREQPPEGDQSVTQND